MKCSVRNFFIIFLLGLGLLAGCAWAKIEKDTDGDGLSDYEEQYVYKTDKTSADTDKDGFADGHEVYSGYSPLKTNREALKQVNLAVPYVSEAPDGNWTGPWKNACEEAAITMAEYFYLGQQTVSVSTAKSFMYKLFNYQDSLYGSNADADATRTLRLINDYTSFQGKIVDNPTLEQIKKELQQKRPVISLHYGFDLQNSNIPFLLTGSSYHMMVIVGYDDDKQEFITNDPGDTKVGSEHRYGYKLFLNSLHDFNFSQGKANGTPRVIFTYPRLVKTADSDAVYYIDIAKNTFHGITDPKIFLDKGWEWDMVAVVDDQWLQSFSAGGNYYYLPDQTENSSKETSTSYTFSSYLYLGSSGQEVRQLQLKLKELGYYTYAEATGYYGPITKAAVVKFQQANNLAPYPGWVGPQTRQLLNK